MSIIRASKTFEGGALSQKSASYIKSDIHTVDFKDKENGVFLFLLGAYKQDSTGAGVWYRPLKIRDNFGSGEYKKKLAVHPLGDPVEYFENRVRQFAPEMAKSKKIQDADGRDRWIYPVWGRNAWRVLYNAAIFNKFDAGVHVLDLPMNGGGNVIDEYVRGKRANGADNPDLTDYKNAIVINVKLDLKAKGQPWKIQIKTDETYELPIELADSDYLYNLDDIVNYPKKEDVIAEIRGLVPSDVFERGFEGYDFGDRPVSMATPVRQNSDSVKYAEEEKDQVPMTFSNPVPAAAAIPKRNVAPAVSIPKTNITRITEADGLPSAPNFTPPAISTSKALADAAAYLTPRK
jgi:hypothetical protein